ncbi:MAG TPA: glycosyltransferase [Burkholderiales bacterium]|nr:glycosyltransferase [Burkholderiales bacterium]
MNLRVAICITTHNRRADIERTLAQIAALAPQPDEILVVADGCTDGTAEFVRERHSGVRLIVHERGRGSIPSRNEMAVATTCDVFLSLDDDSYPLEADAITRIQSLFAMNPRLAVAEFPQRTDEDPRTLERVVSGSGRFTGSYANSGAAIQRAAFTELGGYFEPFFHMYEEPDFALRCVCAGWQVRFETCVTIRHHWSSVQRNEMRNHQRHARNELWSVFLRCPMPWLLAVAPFRVWRQFLYARKRGWSWVWREPRWWWQCLDGISRCLRERTALAWPRYRAWMQLVRAPLENAADWEAKFGTR